MPADYPYCPSQLWLPRNVVVICRCASWRPKSSSSRSVCGSLSCSVCSSLLPCLWLVVTLSVARCHALSVARCHALFVARRHPVCGSFLHIGGGRGWHWRHLCIGGGRLSSLRQREHIVPAGTHLCHLGHPDRLKTVPMELSVTQKTDQTYKS